jgi:hypothetical protein
VRLIPGLTLCLIACTLATMTREPVQEFTPADVARRTAALGVIINPATVWAYLRARFAERHPERVGVAPSVLPVSEAELDEWLDGFLDTVEAERARLARRMNPEPPA